MGVAISSRRCLWRELRERNSWGRASPRLGRVCKCVRERHREGAWHTLSSKVAEPRLPFGKVLVTTKSLSWKQLEQTMAVPMREGRAGLSFSSLGFNGFWDSLRKKQLWLGIHVHLWPCGWAIGNSAPWFYLPQAFG